MQEIRCAMGIRDLQNLALRLSSILLVSLICLPSFAHAEAEEWQPLFNGKDLTGWYTFLTGDGRDNDPNKLIQVHDGVIHFYKDAEDQTGQAIGYICTEEEYSYYRLRFQYKWGKKRFAPRGDALRDSGLLFHVTGPDGRWGGVWPLSVECQVQETDTGDLITVDTRCVTHIAPDTPEGEYPTYLPKEEGGIEYVNTWYVNAGKVCDRLEGWNDVEVIVRGSEGATFIVNGQVNNRLSDIEQPGKEENSWVPLSKGRIAFQVESAEVLYRNIEILPIEPDEKVPYEDSSASTPSSHGDTPPELREKLNSLSVPEGFEVEIAAAAPLVHHPMMACLDDRGRLFIAESDGINRESVPQILEDRPHKILMLEDTNNDGRFDKRTVFAEGLVQANGAQWYDGALYVCSAPYLWRFRDTNGDGRADEATRIVGKFNFDGMSSAFHGPVLGPDGRFYWSGGQHGWRLEQVADQTSNQEPAGAAGRDSKLTGPWTRTAPGAFSSWPDGSQPENVGHGAIANPVETAFTEDGDVLGTVALLDELDGQRHDAVVLWIDGCMYHMKPHNLVGLPRTGPDLEPVSYRAGVAPSGITRYRSASLGSEYQDSFFFAEFNTQRLIHLKVEPSGGTYQSKDAVFLHSSDPDIHFTDVIEDPDGSLLVVDTGGWFLYGCPTSQIAKPDIYGAIYRIRKKGSPQPDDSYGANLDWQDASNEELMSRLIDPRFPVRDRAILELAKRGTSAITTLRLGLRKENANLRLQCLWTLNRIDSSEARLLVRTAISDPSIPVRLAAIQSAGLHYDTDAVPMLVDALASDEPHVRRRAATALGRIKDPATVEPLLRSVTLGTDRFLDHSIIYALIQIGNDHAIHHGLNSDHVDVRRVALIALDQLESSLLDRAVVVQLLDSHNDSLRRTALQVLQRRTEWADEIVGRLEQWLAAPELTAELQSSIRGTVRAFWENEAVDNLVARALQSRETAGETKLLLLETISSIDSKEIPANWIEAISSILNGDDELLARQAIASVTERNMDGFRPRLMEIALDDSSEDSLRFAAATAILKQETSVSDDVLNLLLKCFRESQDSIERLTAAQAIADVKLTHEQLRQIAQLITDADSLSLPTLLIPFESQQDEALGLELVYLLQESPGSESIPRERLNELFASYPDTVRIRAQVLLDRIDAGVEDRSATLEELLKQASGGDPENGKRVFFGQKAACSKCHRVGEVGDEVGPNLSHIGDIRSKRDLIEAVVYPSASFAREYESYSVITLNGQSYSGLISRQTANAIYIRRSDLSEVRIEREDIDEIMPSTTSIMPEGLHKLISAEDFRDLVAFLISLK